MEQAPKSVGTAGPDAIEADIDTLIATFTEHKSATDGDHDARYYTKSQVDQQFQNVAQGAVGNGSITNDMLAADVKIGSLASLNTTIKTNVVTAINEANYNAKRAPAGFIVPMFMGLAWTNSTMATGIGYGPTEDSTQQQENFAYSRILWENTFLGDNKKVYFEAVLKAGTSGNTAFCALKHYGSGNNTIFSSLSTTENAAGGVRVRSAALTLPDTIELQPVIWAGGSSEKCVLYAARLVIL
ncbi:MAG TPA: hypothetical protein VEA37_02480 [Flavobacterium sp.]|nr:hypothetical protein [Flavobacterium sp.]